MLSEPYDPSEQTILLDEFRGMLAAATADGGRKRAAGTKPNWRIDPGHRDALYRHLKRYEDGDAYDEDSGAHPLVHVAWRCLALAYQEDVEQRELQDDYDYTQLKDYWEGC